MMRLLALASLTIVVTVVAYVWRSLHVRHRTLRRLEEGVAREAPPAVERLRGRRPLRRPFLLLPLVAGSILGGSVFFVLGWSVLYSLALGLIVAMLGNQVEAYFAARKAARLESQLADGIDLMVGALGAGASVNNAIEVAIRETTDPLRPQLEEVAGRIRLGDDPVEVFRNLADRVPLEAFLLFSSALSVHWEVGGRLAPTLAIVGRTVRDRIETARRIRTNIVQSQVSTVAVLAITYFLALIVWRNSPEQMEQFVGSNLGGFLVAGSMVMQAAGIVWMNAISRVRF
jgi:Flp pilus assembly protein TadB